MRIATVLLLEDMGANYQIVAELNVEAEPGRDSCLSGSPADGQCCVTGNWSAKNQFGVIVNSSHLYGVVDPRGGPNMIQTHAGVADRLGYQFVQSLYNPASGMLVKQSLGQENEWPVKIFQFIIGRLISKETLFLFQTIALLMQLLPQHLLMPHFPLRLLKLVISLLH